MSTVTLHRVSKVYRVGDEEVRALDEVDLTIAPGELTVVLGPSGSGKSTALNLIGGMDTPTRGRSAQRARASETWTTAGSPPTGATTWGSCSSTTT